MAVARSSSGWSPRWSTPPPPTLPPPSSAPWRRGSRCQSRTRTQSSSYSIRVAWEKQNKEFPLQPPVTLCRTIDQHCKILTKVATALASSVSSESFAFVLHTAWSMRCVYFMVSTHPTPPTPITPYEAKFWRCTRCQRICSEMKKNAVTQVNNNCFKHFIPINSIQASKGRLTFSNLEPTQDHFLQVHMLRFFNRRI